MFESPPGGVTGELKSASALMESSNTLWLKYMLILQDPVLAET